ncbi:MAG: DUF2207 domain-containing protein [Oscillospiraceae bacterium]|nr:DUF2207 domain-containing protein [Oscillospiraceae bacterium]
MRRILIALVLCMLLTMAASATSHITDIQSTTTVSTDGTCRVTVAVVLQLEDAPEKLTFPLPEQAKDVTLNGTITRTSRSDGRRHVNLSSLVHGPGLYTFTIQYHLPDSVSQVGEELILSVDLLSGFAYPVEKMNFSVMLPGAVSQEPRFSSSYLQQSVSGIMTWSMENGVITGTVQDRLQDREALTMNLPVKENMFPQSFAKRLSLDYAVVGMGLCSLALLLYWFLTMRCGPVRHARRTHPPAGLTAGEMGLCLTDRGVDFTLMVISWAQMGYILLQPDDNGRVLLHKRMEMGNERSEFEVRYFKALFGNRKVADGTGFRYAQLCIRAKASRPNRRSRFSEVSGNPKLLRLLSVLVNLLAAISLAKTFTTSTVSLVLLCVLFIPLSAGGSWLLQAGLQNLHLRHKLSLWLGGFLTAVWFILCVMGGRTGMALFTLMLQLFTGLAAGYSGKRTQLGKQHLSEILGLRHYLRNISDAQMQQIILHNPNYYYQIAPYALALGVDRAFTRHWGAKRLPECSYLTTGMDGHLTAREWNRLLRDTVNALDSLQKRLPLDRLLGR